ncbi:hypothetical protein HPB48_026367 [Haemaphysalis longicornis]|uniref:Uncharacterized protein n=1 Tax=Haemaphysalis longicornis TaxID=44386 RepID=A0A9J6HBQ2_HAELO|nr:hypothetical protein HPB48_026367 [Haemaphysalis longicornis]
MSTTAERSQESEYVVPGANSQEVQPSPLALLAATCSKIGSPTDSPADDSGGGDGANGDASPAKSSGSAATTATATVLPAGAGELVAQYVQGPTMGVLNADGTVTPIPAPEWFHLLCAAFPSRRSSLARSLVQVTPSGQIAYNAIPQIQNIQIDGQEAIFIPASFTGGQQAIQLAGGGHALLSNQGFLRPQGFTTQNVAIRQGNMVQTLQIPMQTAAPALQQTIPVQVPISTGNGQTVFQTIHVPVQTLQAVATPQGNMLASGQQLAAAQVVQQLAHMQPQMAQLTAQGQLQQIQVTATAPQPQQAQRTPQQQQQQAAATPTSWAGATQVVMTSTGEAITTAAQPQVVQSAQQQQQQQAAAQQQAAQQNAAAVAAQVQVRHTLTPSPHTAPVPPAFRTTGACSSVSPASSSPYSLAVLWVV